MFKCKINKLTESKIEDFAIKLLEHHGYQYLYGPDIAPDCDAPIRRSFEDVLLPDQLTAAVGRLNPKVPADAREDAIKQIQRLNSPDPVANNEAFHRMLTEGVKVTYQKNGDTRGDYVWLIDFNNPENNEFTVVNQFTVISAASTGSATGVNKRPDVVLFVNGIPLIVIELKNPADENATVHTAYKQIQTYKQAIPAIFTYNGFIVISDGLEARAGSLTSGFNRFMSWKSEDGKTEASNLVGQMEILIRGMLNKATLLDLIRHFIVFEKTKSEDKETGQISIRTEKKLAAYHQYYAVNRAVESTLRAAGTSTGSMTGASINSATGCKSETGLNSLTGMVAEPVEAAIDNLPPYSIDNRKSAIGDYAKESPESYGIHGVRQQPAGDRKGGVVWHTQGSGKSLSMVFYTGKIVLALNNPTIVVITDRNDLDDQLFDTFAASKQLLRQEPVQAESREHLKELLRVGSGGIVFTTIHKFQIGASTSSATGVKTCSTTLPVSEHVELNGRGSANASVYEQLSDRQNIIVIADEAHRTQYGFKPKALDVKDSDKNVIGKRIVYGFAKYMRDALPNATYIGFTGTPIEKDDKNTPAVFGNYIDIYDIAQAVNDGATVRIYYESRLAKIILSEEGRQLIAKLDETLTQPLPEGEEFDDESPSTYRRRDRDEGLKKIDLTLAQKAKAKWTQLEALVGSKDRLKQLAKDMVTHFEQRQEVFNGKGMIVTMSRRIAAELYKEIINIRPEWHNDDLKKGVVKVVMTSASSDGPEIDKHHTTKEQRRALADRMKDPEDELKIVIVRDMWLTGFDVPCLHTMYIDKPMKGHNLMQAIARVNRVYKDKPGGLVVDYLGIASDLKKALAFYADSGGKGDPATIQEQAVQLMLEKIEVVSQMYHGFPYEDFFDMDTGRKLSFILEAENHILGLENGKKRYIDEVTALSRAFALAVPHDQAMDAKEEIAFFQSVKARIAKYDTPGNGRSDEEIESVIRQVIDKALVTDKVIDVFDAAGIKKPDISILSEDFLLEVKNMEQKNVAMEVLKKLLNDEIKSRAKKNLIQSKTLMEMLENSIKRYHNKIITAAEVIEELIEIGKEIKVMDKEPKEMGLSEYEYAFYTAIANNDSARQVMQKDKLRELAVVLFQKVKENASIDWTIKESVKAKLKVIVKRTLRKYGYPPDMQMLATETVLKQAEMLAEEMVNA